MTKKSAGILLYKITEGFVQLFLVHPGGPFFSQKDLGAWSIPKGEFDETENPLAAARREFQEETGQEITGDFLALTPITQKGGKKVYAWAVTGDINAAEVRSNTFEMEWPPKSGTKKEFPEVDRGEWFLAAAAKEKINPAQAPLIDELIEKLGL